jgi:hypothetical protein
VLDRLLREAPATRQKETRRLFGWVTCATRALKWKEIQGAISIDFEYDKVDYERQQLMVDAKDLCGALIEELPNGDVTFVHSTVKP